MSPGSPNIGDPALLGFRRFKKYRVPPVIVDPEERILVKVFLKRYVTWCARTRREGSIPGAVALYRSLD
jgi:hypothetical protein